MPAKKVTPETPETPSTVEPTPESIAAMQADVKRQQDALAAQAKELRAQAKAARATSAKPVKSLVEVEADQYDERAPWLYGYIIIRVQARERAGQSRTDALDCVLANLSLGVTEEMGLRDAKKAQKVASVAEADDDDTGN